MNRPAEWGMGTGPHVEHTRIYELFLGGLFTVTFHHVQYTRETKLQIQSSACAFVCLEAEHRYLLLAWVVLCVVMRELSGVVWSLERYSVGGVAGV